MATTQPIESFGTPGEAGYRAATAAFDTEVVIDPHEAVEATDVASVKAAVRTARASGHGIVPMTTGHHASMLPKDLTQLDLVKTALTTPIRFHEATGEITFPAGATVQQVAEAAAKHGRAILHGSSGGIGAVGFLLGGGMSFYGRLHGIAANSATSFRLVTADADERLVDPTTDPELFWALRGGGGGFGIVTQATWRTLPFSRVVTGLAAWPLDAAADLMAAWGEWTASAPRNITTSLRLMMFPPGQGLPAALTTGQLLTVDGTACPLDGDIATAQSAVDDLLGRLKGIAAPVFDSWHEGPQLDALQTHMDPPVPSPSIGDAFSIGRLSADFAEAWRTVCERPGHQILNAELRQLGGAFADPAPDGGVYDHIEEPVFAYNATVVPDHARAHEIDATILGIRHAVQPWIGRYTPPTFVEHPGMPNISYPTEFDDEVAAIRRRVDPDGLFAADARVPIARRRG